VNKVVLGWTSQKVRHVPMGVVSSPTFVLEDLGLDPDADDRVIASGNATAASWTLTSTAIAGPTQRNGHRISTSATGSASIGAPAVIVAPDGTRELFEVAALSTNSYIESAGKLAGVYPIGSVVSGVLLEADVPDDWAADEERFKQRNAIRLTWTYTLAGIRQSRPEFVHWIRHNAAADGYVGEAVLRVNKLYPNIVLTDGAKVDVIAELMADEVADDIREREREPETLLVGSAGRRILVARVLMHLGEMGWAPGNQPRETWAAERRADYEAKLDRLTIGTAGQTSADVDLATDTSPGTPSTTRPALFLGM
jgi:hypothetical protein